MILVKKTWNNVELLEFSKKAHNHLTGYMVSKPLADIGESPDMTLEDGEFATIGHIRYVDYAPIPLLEKFSNGTRAANFYYTPEAGFLGWHTNCPLDSSYRNYSLLITYSETGESAFRYQIQDTNEVVDCQDHKGLTIRLIDFGVTPNPLWHCVPRSDTVRVTYGVRVDAERVDEVIDYINKLGET